MKSVTSAFRRTSTFYTNFRTGLYIDPPLSVLYNSTVKYMEKREYGFAMFLEYFFSKRLISSSETCINMKIMLAFLNADYRVLMMCSE